MRAPELDLTVDVAELDVADEDLAIDADGGPTMNLSGPCPRSAGLSGQAGDLTVDVAELVVDDADLAARLETMGSGVPQCVPTVICPSMRLTIRPGGGSRDASF